jgi:hypothetical protein
MRNNRHFSCLGIIIVGGISIWLLMHYPYAVLAVLVLCFIGVLLKPTRCQICNNLLGRNKYEWELEGKRKRVCAHCNQNLQRKNSRDAMKNVK